MKYNIPTIANTDLNVAESAQIGAEITLLASYDEFISVGNISMPVPASGILNPNTTFIDPGQNNGLDMQLITDDGVLSSVQIVVTLAVVVDDGTLNGVPGVAVASFSGPAGDWAENQSFNMPKGLATDLTVVGNPIQKIRSITGVVSVVGGSANAKFDIWALPGNWFNISCVMQKDPTLPVSKSHPIRDGYNPSRFVKKIPGEPGKLALTTKRRSYGDGLERLNGARVSIMLLSQKDGYLICERQVYGGLRFAANPKFPDADAEAEVTAESFFESWAVFI